MYGYQRAEEIVGMRVGDFLSHSAQENVESLRAFVRSRYRIVDAESREIDREGYVRYFLNNLVGVIEDGCLVRVWGTQRDITERKRAEEALRESEERFRSAFESAAIGMALVGLDGSWLEVNQPFSDLVGYSQGEMAGMSFQEITHPDDLDANLDRTRRLAAGEIPSYQMEKRYIHKAGHAVWGLLSASLVRDADGNPLYGIDQVQDITQRKRAEEALKQSERLYRAVI